MSPVIIYILVVTQLVRIRVNLIGIWKMDSFLMLKSIQTVMMEIIFQQVKVLKGLWTLDPLKVFPVLMHQLRLCLS